MNNFFSSQKIGRGSIFAFFVVYVITGFFPTPTNAVFQPKEGEPNPEETLVIRFQNAETPVLISVPERSKEKALAALSQDPKVTYVEPNSKVYASAVPNDPLYLKNQQYLAQVHVPEAWEVTTGSREVVVAILDAGVDIYHEDLLANVWINRDELAGDGKDNDGNGYVDDINGYDFISNDADPRPEVPDVDDVDAGGASHGTVIAGLIGAVGGNQVGITGVSWNVRIMPVRILNEKGEGDVASVINGIRYAVKNGADVINMSFVGYEQNFGLDDVIKEAYEQNAVLVAAAGNAFYSGKGSDLDVPQARSYPACSYVFKQQNYVLGVAALDADDVLARFSNYGHDCVDLSAPGVSLFSTQTIMSSAGLDQPYGDSLWSGTSFAAPLVSGTAALMLTANPALHNTDVYQLLLQSGDDISSENPSVPDKVGKKLNAGAAVRAAKVFVAGESKPSETQPSTPVKTDPPADRLNTARVGILKENKKNTSLVVLNQDFQMTSASDVAVPYVSAVVADDIDHDGAFEYVMMLAGNKKVRVYEQDGTLKHEFSVFEKGAPKSADLTLADLDGDGISEVLVSSISRAKPVISVYRQNGEKIRDIVVYDRFSIDLNIAAGDLDGDGNDEIVAGAGSGGGPQVSVFDGDGTLIRRFFVDNARLRAGANIAVADTDADGKNEIIFLKLQPSKGVQLLSFFADGTPSPISANLEHAKQVSDVVFGQWDGSGADEIMVVSGGKERKLEVYNWNSQSQAEAGVKDLGVVGRFFFWLFP